jgi:hypothetical protein
MLKLVGRAEGDADADADRLVDPQIGKRGLIDQALAALGDLLGLGGRGARQEGGEFVAAQAIQAIVGAQRHHQRIGNDGQHAVTLGMAVGVVDGFETIAVEQRKETRSGAA